MLDWMKVYELCNQFQWYTCGTNEEYERMFKLVREKAALMDIAYDIFDHSDHDRIRTVGAVYQELVKFVD